jgi:aryl-alcohol dehydrogenase-like predicted oxidoreductase
MNSTVIHTDCCIVVLIPGTKRRAYLEENTAAAEIELSCEILDQLDQAAPVGAISGDRYNERIMSAIDQR